MVLFSLVDSLRNSHNHDFYFQRPRPCFLATRSLHPPFTRSAMPLVPHLPEVFTFYPVIACSLLEILNFDLTLATLILSRPLLRSSPQNQPCFLELQRSLRPTSRYSFPAPTATPIDQTSATSTRTEPVDFIPALVQLDGQPTTTWRRVSPTPHLRNVSVPIAFTVINNTDNCDVSTTCQRHRCQQRRRP